MRATTVDDHPFTLIGLGHQRIAHITGGEDPERDFELTGSRRGGYEAEMAIGAIFAARELGLSVPGDLSVIGIDGHDLSEVFGLTTINQFPQRQGERAVERLLAQLSGAEKEAGPLNEKLDVEFVVRSSTAVPDRR